MFFTDADLSLSESLAETYNFMKNMGECVKHLHELQTLMLTKCMIHTTSEVNLYKKLIVVLLL